MSAMDLSLLRVDAFENYLKEAMASRFEPIWRVGYRWHDPGDKPLTLEGVQAGEISWADGDGKVHDILFYTDNPTAWCPAHIKGSTLYRFEFISHRPKAFALWPSPFEWFGEKDYAQWRSAGFDVVTYTPSKTLRDDGTRQAVLLNPRVQVVSVTRVLEIP